MTKPPRRLALLALAAAAVVAASLPASWPSRAQERSIVVASTTSTEQSGLFGHILPLFTRDTGTAVRVVALGTGQALDGARRGDADVVFVHDREAEERFVADGYRPRPPSVHASGRIPRKPRTSPPTDAATDTST